MPLMRPEVQKVLRAAGLQENSIVTEESSISEKLDAAGLTQDTIADELFNLAKNSTNEALRLRALETALKAHGALKETAATPPSFTLIIQSSPNSSVQIPQNLPEGVNPILLPRQLINTLNNNSREKEAN